MADSLQGRFLVATPQLRDPNFIRTVVLLLESNNESAIGLVVNRPSSITLDAAFAQAEDTPMSTASIFCGGPVETDSLFILHDCPNVGQYDDHVSNGIFLTGNNDSFSSLIGPEKSCQHMCGFRVYHGYAGWDAAQLQNEIDRGDWRTLDATARMVLHMDAYEIWHLSQERLNQENRLLPHNALNPNWN